MIDAPVPCARGGCDGLIERGFCSVCGRAPKRRPKPPPPAAPQRDPATGVLLNPVVPEDERFCTNCGNPVGRGPDGQEARVSGFCGTCRQPFDLTPRLRPGDLVRDQYRVVGCLAHGGLGWIYLALDENVNGVQRVLKGVLNSADAEKAEAIVNELGFLSSVRHRNIVRVVNSVKHDDYPYIVMDHLNGPTLKQVRERGTLPAVEAISIVLQVLPALGYLHSRGLLYCDFSLGNVILEEDGPQLIDLGSMRQIGSDPPERAVGTVGLTAPETIEHRMYSIASDLYTVARSLFYLCCDWSGFFATDGPAIPPIGELAEIAKYEGLYRFLVKATAEDPLRRYTSANEMLEQLIGVRRQVEAVDAGRPVPFTSRLFTSSTSAVTGDAVGWAALPVPAVDAGDPAAATLANLAGSSPDAVKAALMAAPVTPEVELRKARMLIEEDNYEGARAALHSAGPNEWRTRWWRGVLALATGDPVGARGEFEVLAEQMPGELAPQLAVAASCELAAVADEQGRAQLLEQAEHEYAAVAGANSDYQMAPIGLVRVRVALGRGELAAASLDLIAKDSPAYAEAQRALYDGLLSTRADGSRPSRDDLVVAAGELPRLKVEASVRAALAERLFTTAADHLTVHREAPDCTLIGLPLTEKGVARGRERSYREQARQAATREERIRLTDLANRVRPRSLW